MNCYYWRVLYDIDCSTILYVPILLYTKWEAHQLMLDQGQFSIRVRITGEHRFSIPCS